jgi:uncharacterized membrane protein
VIFAVGTLLVQLLRGVRLVTWQGLSVSAPGLAEALLVGASAWVLYLAAEPYVRHRWPRTLVGWSRLVGGRWGTLSRVVLAATVMGVVVLLLGQVEALGATDSKMGLLILIGSGAVAYAVALLALGGIEKREIEFVRRMALERLKRGSSS